MPALATPPALDRAALRKEIQREALLKLAPTNLYAYAKLIRPSFYDTDKPYLKTVCDTIDHFLYGQNKKRVLVLNMPPRFGKSLTAQTASEYVFGREPKRKIMTGSYNETLSTTFATTVRDTISTRKADDATIVYSDIFPHTRIQQGEAAKDLWALEGAQGKSYLATSPTGTATGFGVDLLVIDDIIKNAQEALNDRVLEERWQWFTSTMLQRLEGDWRIIIIMTRWAKGDIAGRVIEKFGQQVEVVSMPAINKDGTMLCDAVLTRADYEFKVQEMLRPIAEANYLQRPIDIQGQLYPTLASYTLADIDKDAWEAAKTYARTDTADTGNDYLCTLVFKLLDNEAYILDAIFTQDDMDTTEELVADVLYNNDVKEATFEGNNGGRLFSKNVERRLTEKYGTNKVIIRSEPQTKNKEARILASSAWVRKHLYMPHNWHIRWPELARNVTSYQAKGKNDHDDAPDVLASIYEQATGILRPSVYNKADISTNRRAQRRSYWQR